MAIRIADALALPEKVNLGRGQIELTGLDATQIARLIVMYKDQIMGFLGADAIDFSGIIVAAPEMVIDIIAASAGAEDQRDDIRKIPVAIQLECLQAVYRLSVPDEKKFTSALETILKSLQAAKSRSQSEAGHTNNSATSSSDGSTGSSGRGTLKVLSNI